MCAQKRPSDGFFATRSSYKEIDTSLADYLAVMDDDTYMNMNNAAPFLQTAYPSHEAHAVAVRMIRSRVSEHNFTMPFGGRGTRPAIENFQEPLYCQQYQYNHNTTLAPVLSSGDSDGKDDFTNLACWRLSQDSIGEAAVFVERMSVAELILA
jgi:hypothetical protein